VVRVAHDQRSKTPWSCGIGGPYGKHIGQKMDRQWTMFKNLQWRPVRKINKCCLPERSIKERLTSLAKDDKLSAYWDATSIFLKFCLLLVVLKK